MTWIDARNNLDTRSRRPGGGTSCLTCIPQGLLLCGLFQRLLLHDPDVWSQLGRAMTGISVAKKRSIRYPPYATNTKECAQIWMAISQLPPSIAVPAHTGRRLPIAFQQSSEFALWTTLSTRALKLNSIVPGLPQAAARPSIATSLACSSP